MSFGEDYRFEPLTGQTLAENCVTLEGDTCRNTTAAKHEAAQDAAESIATLKGVRWAGLAAMTVGAAGVVVAIVNLLNGDRRDAGQNALRA